MEDTEQQAVTRSHMSRSTQACQRCRCLKTRCLPSNQIGTCQRCVAAGRECAWAEIPRRARKLRAPSRISEVEKKIDGLVASLVNPSTINCTPPLTAESSSVSAASSGSNENELHVRATIRKSAPGSWMQVPTSFEIEQHEPGAELVSGNTETDRQFIETVRGAHTFNDSGDVNQVPERPFQASKTRDLPIEDVLVKQLLASGEADALLNGYRDMARSFPFVPLHPNTSSQDLHAKKPMLFLAMITAASWKEHQQQIALDTIYRKELANRTIVTPRKTLGLVQSVLVYLSWYHFVFSHKTQQIFFLHHLVIGLALDIGLHQDYQPLRFAHRPKLPPPSAQDQRERQRTFLGCYYMASVMAAGFQKSNLLKYTPVMTEWAQNLKREREYKSDEIISHLIALRQLNDQAQDALFSQDAVDLPLTDTRTLMHVQFLESQLDVWKREVFGNEWRRMLDLSSSFTDMVLHSVALRTQPASEQQATHGSVRLKALLSTLEAGKHFLDTLISFPAYNYHLLSFSEWTHLPVVVMTMARLCIPADAHVAAGWDVKAAQDRVRLDLCLESFCYRMQSLTTYDKINQSHPDFWYALRAIMDMTRIWYVKKITAEGSTGISPSHMQNNTMATPTSTPELNSASRLTPLSDHNAAQCPSAMDMNFGSLMDVGTEDQNNQMAFMQDVNFEMDHLFDLGIWGNEGYNGLGFGDGMMF